jgi:hypothetical protein
MQNGSNLRGWKQNESEIDNVDFIEAWEKLGAWYFPGHYSRLSRHLLNILLPILYFTGLYTNVTRGMLVRVTHLGKINEIGI